MILIGEHKIYQYYIKLCTKLRPPIKHNAIIIHHNGKNLQKKGNVRFWMEHAFKEVYGLVDERIE